jgi:hypothetical protein
MGLDLHQIQLIVGSEIHPRMRGGLYQFFLPLHLQLSQLEFFQKGGPFLLVFRLMSRKGPRSAGKGASRSIFFAVLKKAANG